MRCMKIWIGHVKMRYFYSVLMIYVTCLIKVEQVTEELKQSFEFDYFLILSKCFYDVNASEGNRKLKRSKEKNETEKKTACECHF